MAANLSAFIKYLGHSHIAIKSIVTGKTGAQEGHFQAITINKAEEFITLRNGKRQLWINLQKLKPEIGKYIAFSDIESYKNVYIDLDCEKPDGMKDYAATEAERVNALSQLPILRAWLESHSLKCGLELHTGNGAGMVLPIPETKAEPVFIAKLSTFLKILQAAIPCTDPAMFDPPRVIGIPGTINAKLETEERKNQMREIVGDIPARVEDRALLDFINSMEPDQAALKTYRAKYNAPPDTATPEDAPTSPEMELSADCVEILQYLCAADQLFEAKFTTPAPAGIRSSVECYLCARMWEAGFGRPEIYQIMTSSTQTKWAQRDEAYRQSTLEAGIAKAEETRKELIGLTEEELIAVTSTDVDAFDDMEVIRSLAGIKKRTPARYDVLIAAIKKPHKNLRAATIREAVDKYTDTRTWNADGPKYSHTSSAPFQEMSGLHEISVTNRHMQDISAESMPELIKYNSPPSIFVKGGCLVRTAEDETGIMRIELLSEKVLRSILSRCAAYVKVESNGKGGETTIPTNAPIIVVTDIMAQSDWPGIVPILGLITSPVVRPDGSIVEQLGYDAATHLYYTGKTKMALNVHEMPTQAEAQEAAAYIVKEVFGDFPFKDQASRANTIAALLTTLTLPLINGNIPLGLFDKPQAGTGASLLTEIIAEIATGAKANMQTAPDSDDEWRKAITAVLISGPQIVVVDNVTAMLKSAKLSQMLTARTWSDRMLGLSKMLSLPQTAAWFATGNNIQLGGDIARRAYWIRLDAAIAQPWLRDEFRHPDLMKWVHEHRSELLSMLLTMVRAWIVAGKPKGTAPRIGSFEEWSKTIGGILTYAGVDGFIENAAELYASADQETGQWDLFLEQWQKLHRDGKITAALLKTELTDHQLVYRPLQNEMPEEIIIATDKTKRGAVALGQVLRRRAEQVFPSGRKIVATLDKHTKATWWSVVSTSTPDEAEVAEVDQKPQSTAGSQTAEVAEVILIPSSEKVEYECIVEEIEEIREIKGKNVVGLRSTTATSASVAVDSEIVKAATSANPDLEHFRENVRIRRKNTCLMCGQHFEIPLQIGYQGGYICEPCRRDGPPPAPAHVDVQVKLSEAA
jgi:hypothetical protein